MISKKCFVTNCNSKKVQKKNIFKYCGRHIRELNVCYCCCENNAYTKKYYCSSGHVNHTICHNCIMEYLNNNYLIYVYKQTKINKCCYSECNGFYNINDILLKNKYLILKQDFNSEEKEIAIIKQSFSKTVQETLSNNRIRRCNNCKTRIIRIDACNHIECRCGHRLCYNCGETITSYCASCSQWTDEKTIEEQAFIKSYNELIIIFGEEKKDKIMKEINNTHNFNAVNTNNSSKFKIIYIFLIIICLALFHLMVYKTYI